MVVSVIIFIFSIKFQFEFMTFSDLSLSLLGGIFAGLGISAVIYGSQTLPASVFGLTSYVQIIFGVILGWFVFQQLPTLYNYIGILIVISAGIILFYFDKSQKNNKLIDFSHNFICSFIFNFYFYIFIYFFDYSDASINKLLRFYNINFWSG